MYEVVIRNCNNIKEGTINIEPNKLNIKYGINGTGKTTVAKAMRCSTDGEHDKLQSLKSYYSDAAAQVSVTPRFGKILVYDEEFVNQFVFLKNEVIKNSFEVFFKSPDYDNKKAILDSHLEALHGILTDDNDVIKFREKLKTINEKFRRTSTGKLSKTGALKSLLSKQNLYNIPSELESYRPFFDNKVNNIAWIDWVNKGMVFDTIENCPYCSMNMDMTKHRKQKEVFQSTYTKVDSQNLKEVYELVQDLEEFMSREKYNEFIGYIKMDTPEDVISAIVQKLTTEFNLIIERLDAIDGFGRKQIAIADIDNLDRQISGMEFPMNIFEIFTGKRANDVFVKINEKIGVLKAEVINLKNEMGDLKRFLSSAVRKSQTDINNFLKTAGINYEIEINVEDELNSKTVLKQCFSDEKTDVDDIKQHLSWGEKNAFSLVLFMYYAYMQNADLIILDDPISSFDSNKKYAILHRMFKTTHRSKISLVDKTVLMLTHDFEPIIDFVLVGKLSRDHISASFVWNTGGILHESDIDPRQDRQDICTVMYECEHISRDCSVNIVSRVAFLRKLCEFHKGNADWDNAYEILSCLIHTKETERRCRDGYSVTTDFSDGNNGIDKIKEFISDFDYDSLRDKIYSLEGLKNLFASESNAYFKVQLFRALRKLPHNMVTLPHLEEGLCKFIDETYHIENDNLYYLDIMKFNIVPDYISRKVDDIFRNL